MNDFKNMSERYRRQMLDLYKKYPQDTPLEQSKDYNIQEEATNKNNTLINTNMEEEPSQYTIEPYKTPEETSNTYDNITTDEDSKPIEERYPTPVIPPFIYQSNKEDLAIIPQSQSPTITQPSEIGYLKVVVTSAEQTVPLSNVSVMISKINGDNQELIYSLLTNDNGETEIVELLAPSRELSESPNNSDIKPYSEYNITTYLSGYYQVVNTSVPIFANTTSIQNINMIPLPSYTIERKVINLKEFEPDL